MTFKVGDRVAALDDTIEGVVIRVDGSAIYIEDSDGFELEYTVDELVPVGPSEFSKNLFSRTSVKEIISEKESPKRKQRTRSKKRLKEEPAMEVDLHIEKLTDSARSMPNHDMLNLQLDTARRQLEFAIKKRIPKIVFIHGVGEGVLKLELEYLFGRYDNIAYYEASYQKYGTGATEVKIFQSKNH